MHSLQSLKGVVECKPGEASVSFGPLPHALASLKKPLPGMEGLGGEEGGETVVGM